MQLSETFALCESEELEFAVKDENAGKQFYAEMGLQNKRCSC